MADDSSLRLRFFAKTRWSPVGCLEWTAALNGGYGSFNFEGTPRSAHRVAWFLEFGRWPLDCLLHRCDNRLCVHIAHLFEGSRADNTADMIAKGRARGGAWQKSKNTLSGRAFVGGSVYSRWAAPL